MQWHNKTQAPSIQALNLCIFFSRFLYKNYVAFDEGTCFVAYHSSFFYIYPSAYYYLSFLPTQYLDIPFPPPTIPLSFSTIKLFIYLLFYLFVIYYHTKTQI